jgi:hypothetical protein
MIGRVLRAVRRVVAALRAAVGRVRAALAPAPADDDEAPVSIPVTWSDPPLDSTPTAPAIPRRMPPRKPRVK